MPPTTSGFPLAFGRCVFPGARRVAAFAVKLIGCPDCAVKMPETCHPPRIQLAGPALQPSAVRAHRQLIDEALDVAVKAIVFGASAAQFDVRRRDDAAVGSRPASS